MGPTPFLTPSNINFMEHYSIFCEKNSIDDNCHCIYFYCDNHDPSFLGVWVGPSFSWWSIGRANSQPERADPNLEKEGPTPIPRKKTTKKNDIF